MQKTIQIKPKNKMLALITSCWTASLNP